jgi:two-component system chemotaxis response regulator CheY
MIIHAMKDTNTGGAPSDKPISAAGSGGAQPRHRVLVADDDSCIRQLTADVLIQSGYQAWAVSDGAAAWRALNKDSYDLLITDYNMPELTGIELLRKLRGARMALPVILVSGVIPKEELILYPWLKPTATLLKPYSVVELLGTVREVLQTATSAGRQGESRPTWRDQPPSENLSL